MYTLKSHVEERVPAWEVCISCDGTGNDHSLFHEKMDPPIPVCSVCNGSGGTWHPDCGSTGLVYDGVSKSFCHVTKSSFLVRRWECTRVHTSMEEPKPCDKCTAGEWEVE